MKHGVWLLLGLVVGCGASMVVAPGASGSRHAPVNEGSLGGVIKYRNQGFASVVKARREDAYQQMYATCGGSYRIDAEGPRTEGGVVTPVGNGAEYSSEEYWYIQFSCAPKAPAQAASSLAPPPAAPAPTAK